MKFEHYGCLDKARYLQSLAGFYPGFDLGGGKVMVGTGPAGRGDLAVWVQHSQKVFQYLSLLRVYILKHSETILPVEKGMVIIKYCHLLVRTYHHWAFIKPLSSGQKPHRNRTLLIRDYCKDTICYVECWPIRKTKIFITAQPTWASANSLVDDGGYGVTCTLLLACTCIIGLHGVLNPITTHLF